MDDGAKLSAIATNCASASPESSTISMPVGMMGSGLEGARLLGHHFEEEQEGELLDVVLIGGAVVPQDVAVIPELLDDGGAVAHRERVSCGVLDRVPGHTTVISKVLGPAFGRGLPSRVIPTPKMSP